MLSDPMLTNGDRQRLAGILALLSSDRAGERDAAAHAATRFLKARALQWRDVLDVPASRSERLEDLATNWREVATACADNGRDLLTDWEYRFCRTLSGFERCSPKQLSILARLVDRLAAEGVMP